MNINDIRFNVYRNRWIGCMLQEKGYKVIPTIQWALEDTYDICFSGVEKGSVIIISTLGCIHNKDTFINKQIKVIDFEHSHHGIKPHIHYNLDHTDKGIALSQDDKDLIKKIKRRL